MESKTFEILSGVLNLGMGAIFVFFARSAYTAAKESRGQRDKLINYLEKMTSDVLLRRNIKLKEGLDDALKEVEEKEGAIEKRDGTIEEQDGAIKTLEETLKDVPKFYRTGLVSGLSIANQTIRKVKDTEIEKEWVDPAERLVDIIVKSSSLIEGYASWAILERYDAIPLKTHEGTLWASPAFVEGKWKMKFGPFEEKPPQGST